jgi:prepilin signal peptidase PulO-like enzyme (type II secretory pathway)
LSDDPQSPEQPSLPRLDAAQGNEKFEQVDAPKWIEADEVIALVRNTRPRWRWYHVRPLVFLIGLLILGWVLYAVVWPPIEIRQKIASAKWKYSPYDLELSIPTRMLLRTCEYLYCFWFFYLGASIGSFINVVASRTPQGKTIVSRGSHCPYCDRPLSMLDNTPVFGWVGLRGRCRTCHLPISRRYLVMEVALGAIFMILAIVELMGNGMNLPHRDWKLGSGIVSTVFYPKWSLIGAVVSHASLFAIAVMLIGSHMDRLRFPPLPLIIIGILYIVCATLNPIVAPLNWVEPWGERYAFLGVEPWERCLTSLVGTAAGLGIGLLFAMVLWRAYLRPCRSDANVELGESDAASRSAWFTHTVALFGLAGALLGWQAVFQVALAAFGVIVLALSCFPVRNTVCLSKHVDLRRQVLALALLTSTLFLHHCFWRQVAFLSFLPFRPGN